MKKTITILILVALPIILMAQRGPRFEENRERIEAQKVAYLTRELNLTPEEAQQFWPVYNEFSEKREAIIKTNRDQMRRLKEMDISGISEKEAEEIADQQLVHAQKMLDLRKAYHSQFKAILPAIKVLKLYKAEEDFKRLLLDRLRGRHGKRGR